MNRFARQIILPGFGKEGQEKLSRARVLVVGVGGLGCPALLHLAAAGVGTIGLADGDNISKSNLNRQTLFGQQHIGRPKAKTAAGILKEKYPDINFKVFPEFLNSQNAMDIVGEYDLVLDGSDNFGTRYMVNDACVLLQKPLVMGAIYQYEGQVTVFNFGNDPVNYRDLYPDPPEGKQVPNCNETGVLGVLPGIIGTLQATEAIKILTGIGTILTKKMLFYNLKNSSFYELAIQPNPAVREKIPESKEAFRRKIYDISCGNAEEISWEIAIDWNKNMDSSLLVDIREPQEEPFFEEENIVKVPKDDLRENYERLSQYENVLLFCRSGQRSGKLAAELKQRFPEKKIFSVKGGILDPSSPLNIKKNESKT